MATDHHPDHRAGWQHGGIAHGDGLFARGLARARQWWRGYHWSWPAFLKWTGAVLVALLFGAVLTLYFLDWNTMRGVVGRYVSHRIGREVRIEGNLSVQLFSWTPSLTAERVIVVNPVWAKGKLAADIKRFSISVRLMPLLSGRTIIPSVEFDEPDILVVRDANGRTNWEMGGSTEESVTLPPIHRFVVRNGHLRVEDAVRRIVFDGTVSSNEQRGAGDRAFALTGEGTLNDNRFLADVHGGPLINVDTSKPYRFAADIRSGTTRILADGALAKPFHIGQFSAKAEFSGSSMSDLYYLTGLVFPATPPYRLNSTVTRDGAIYSFKNMHGVIGQSDVHGEMMVDAGQTPTFLSAQLASRQLRLIDLGPFIGAPAVSHGRMKAELPPVKTDGAVMTRGLALPDTPLDVARVRQMNADVRYDAQSIVSQDFPLRDFHTHFVLKDGVLKFDPLTFDFSRGKLNGWVTIDARKDTPVTDLDARLSGIHLEQFVAGNPPPVEGVLEARAKLHATGNSVHKAASRADGAVTFVVPGGKVRKAFAELTGIDVLNGLGLLLTGDKSGADLRCAVVRFDARNGNLASENFVVDTESVLIQGKGSVNLQNETMALEVKGAPKEFRVGRIRAPITISGPLDNPSIGVKAEGALGQGGLALGLGLLNPLAAILAFVDPGLAKDANCAALTQSAAKGPAPVKAAKRVRH